MSAADTAPGTARPLAVISGGGSGIGLASALRLARDGFALALIGRRAEVLDAAAAQIRERTPAGTTPAHGSPCWNGGAPPRW